MKLFKTGEKRGKSKIKIKKYIALIIAGTMLMGSVSYAAGNVTKYYGDLKNIKDYTNQSGFCTDDAGNFYFARRTDEKKGDLVRVYKLDKNNKLTVFIKEKGVTDNNIRGEKRPIKLGHANDMTYCDRDGCIYICSKGGKNDTNVVIDIFDVKDENGKCLEKGKYHRDHCYMNTSDDLGISPSGIAYDRDRDVFYLTRKITDKDKKERYYVNVVKLQDGRVTKVKGKVELQLEKFDKYIPQGITYSKGYLYVSLWEANGTVDGKKYSGQNNSLVVRYKIDDGNKEYIFKKDSHIRLKHDTQKNAKYEIEGINFMRDPKTLKDTNILCMAVNADSDKEKNTDAIYKYTWK